MQCFDGGNYKEAAERFKALSAARSDDNVAKYYITLLERFFMQEKAPCEEDDFGVACNADLKCFRLLSK